MADLDLFKDVNDTCGHAAGDAVLKTFAALLKANTRASNVCGRIGGEEFVVVLTHIHKPNIQMVVERIRHQLEAEKFTFGGRTFSVTASFGIAGFQGGEAPKFAQLLKEADAALYAAKRAGRNRAEFATSGTHGGGMQW
jgi:diguanylate cyclase (GGDEF)-like protein